MVVGLGQAGGNIATEFHRRGYRALALNTAHTDLAALDAGGVYPEMPADRRLYIGLDGYDGAGADPSYGAECVAAHEDAVRTAILEEAVGADAVILAAGLGGGTGSAINSLLNVLRNTDLPLVGLLTLPTEAESALAKVNTVRAINDLVDAPLSAWIFIDNARVASLHQDVSIMEYYPHINRTLAEPLDALNRLNAREDLRVIRSFDGEDFRKLLLSGGVVNYGTVELPNITVDEVAGAFADCLEASDLMPSGFEAASVSYIGMVIEAPDAVLNRTPVSTFEAIDQRLKQQTGGAAVYRGIYRSSTDRTTMRMMAATRSLPHRIRELLASARLEGLILQDKLQEQLPTLELGDIQDFELFRPEGRNRASERPRRVAPRRGAPLEDIKLDAVRGKPRPVAEATPPEPPKPAVEPRATTTDPRSAAPEPRPSASAAAQPPRPSAPSPRRRPAPTPTPSRPPRPTSRVGGATPRRVEHGEDTINRPLVIEPAATDEVLQEALHAQSSPIDLSEVGSSRLMAEPGTSDAETSEIDLEHEMARAKTGKRRPPRPPPPGDDSGVSPELYDQLVTDFLHADSDEDRHVIAQRLEDDSLSEHTEVRYYAVDAMSKLGRETFGSALLAASEDENDAVRSLALEALQR